MVIWLIVIFILVYFGLSVGYLFIFTLAGRYGYTNHWTWNSATPGTFRRIAVLVPSYKEDGIIMATAENLLGQDYPATAFDVHILADSLERTTIDKLQSLPLFVWEVSFRQSTKARSLNAFFARNNHPYDLALICDADNMLDPLFLQKINRAFDLGARAVQGKRVAKNMDTPFAILDSCSEAINNHIFRKGANGLGLSSSVIGSGMAFEYKMLQGILESIDAVGGFDKPLQLKVVAAGAPIQYLDDAIVFDEKIDNSAAFQNQRRRWLSSQYIYLLQSFIPGWKQLFKGNVNYFNLAVCNNLVPPRALLLGALPLVTIGAFFVNPWMGLCGLELWLLYIATLLLALPKGYMGRDLGRALLRLPGAIAMMAANLLHLRSANKTFIHTLHTHTTISNNVLKRQHGS